MRKVSNRFSVIAVAFAFICLTSANAIAQDPGLVGSWQTKDSDLTMQVTFHPDGTGVLDGNPIKYSVHGAQLIVSEAGTVNNYTFKLNGDELVVSGGNLQSPLTFARQSNSKGFGRRRIESSAPRPSVEEPKQNGLVGRWQSSEATVQVNEDGTLVLNGTPLRYVVKGNVITIGNDDGVMSFPFQLSGDTLEVQVDGRTVVYKRLDQGSRVENIGRASGSNPPELWGKWCYMSNINSSSGGRMSNRCFTLYENGTYEYYAETSSSGPVASSASQESDSGTWTATATTITKHSRSLGSETYSLEKRNHPKTGDPMLVLDGDAYVTYSPRPPW